MGLFKPAVNSQAFLKMGIRGFMGSGKTYTASAVAIGLVKFAKLDKPVFVCDTETGIDFRLQQFKDAGVPVPQVAKSGAFADLVPALDEAEKGASVLIIDSISYFWKDIQKSYLESKGLKRMRLQDWSVVKANWAKFTDRFINSKLHILMLGRAADDIENYRDEEGELQYQKIGTKLQAEKNLDFEPSLVVEMESVTKGPLRKGERNIVNRAFILKDRFDVINGQSFDNPNFDTFLPHIQRLNLGGEHVGVDTSKSSVAVFGKDSDDNLYEQRRQREILIEELAGELLSAYPGQSTDEKKTKTDLVAKAFGTRSWEALRDFEAKKLKEGLAIVKYEIASRLRKTEAAQQNDSGNGNKEAQPKKLAKV